MYRLILFIKKIYVLLLFIFFEIVAVNYYASSTSHTRAKLLTASNIVVGGIHKQLSGIGDYFGLRRENAILAERVSELQNRIELLNAALPVADSLPVLGGEAGKYTFAPASVIDNSISRLHNYITIDKGAADGIKQNMALITPEGTIVGYIENAGDKFSVAMSILNTEFHTGGRIQNTDFFGSVKWDGTDHRYVTLSEIPKYAEITRGDTIVTGYSFIFPPDVLIGTVERFEMNQSSYYDVTVELATPMARLKKVLVVDYADIQERLLLEEELADRSQ